MKVQFGDLPDDAQELLTQHLRVDFTRVRLQGPALVLGVGPQRRRATSRASSPSSFRTGSRASVTILVLDPRCMSRRVLRAIFTAAFTQARRLTAEVEPDNRRALRQVQRMGFVYEGYRRLGLEGTRDTLVYGMLQGRLQISPGLQGPDRAWRPRRCRTTSMKGCTDGQSTLSAPDPYATAAAQNQQNQHASQYNSVAGNANEVNPYGSVSYKAIEQVPIYTNGQITRLRAALSAHHGALRPTSRSCMGSRPRASTTWARRPSSSRRSCASISRTTSIDPSKWQAVADQPQEAGPAAGSGPHRPRRHREGDDGELQPQRRAAGERAGSAARGARPLAGRQGLRQLPDAARRQPRRGRAQGVSHVRRREPQRRKPPTTTSAPSASTWIRRSPNYYNNLRGGADAGSLRGAQPADQRDHRADERLAGDHPAIPAVPRLAGQASNIAQYINDNYKAESASGVQTNAGIFSMVGGLAKMIPMP